MRSSSRIALALALSLAACIVLAGCGVRPSAPHTYGAASYDRTSPVVVYASRSGVPAIASLASPQSGPDGSAALQALANLNGAGGAYAGRALEIVVDIPVLCNQIALSSGTTIRGLGCGSQLTPGVNPATGLWFKALPFSGAGSSNSCVIKNAHWASNYNAGSPSSSPLTCANIVDQDITIRDLYIDGQKRNGVSGRGTGLGRLNASGNFMSPVQIFGCSNLKIERVSVYDPPSYHFWCANISYGVFRDLRVCDPSAFAGTYFSGQNSDGLHLNGPWSDIEIDGLSGSTGDDFLALNAADGNLDTLADETLFFSFATVYYGNGSRLTARNLYPYKSTTILRILTGKDTVNSGTTACTVDQAEVTNVVGSTVSGSLVGTTFPQAGTGGVTRRVALRDWSLDILPLGSYAGSMGFGIGGVWNDLTISNHHYRDVQGGGSISHQIHLDSGAVVGRLLVENYWIAEDGSETASPTTAVSVASGATVDELILRDSGWNRNAATNLAFATVSGGTVGRVSLNGVSCNNIANLLSITGGTVTQVDTANICQRNPYVSGAAGGAAINVGTGVTVSNLTSCGSDTAALVGTSAGTVTTKKTDGTERGA